MPNKISAFSKKNPGVVTYSLVHRSQHDTLCDDPSAPARCLLPVQPGNMKKKLTVEEKLQRKEELANYGVFVHELDHDDDESYDYMQHLKSRTNEFGNVQMGEAITITNFNRNSIPQTSLKPNFLRSDSPEESHCSTKDQSISHDQRLQDNLTVYDNDDDEDIADKESLQEIDVLLQDDENIPLADETDIDDLFGTLLNNEDEMVDGENNIQLVNASNNKYVMKRFLRDENAEIIDETDAALTGPLNLLGLVENSLSSDESDEDEFSENGDKVDNTMSYYQQLEDAKLGSLLKEMRRIKREGFGALQDTCSFKSSLMPESELSLAAVEHFNKNWDNRKVSVKKLEEDRQESGLDKEVILQCLAAVENDVEVEINSDEDFFPSERKVMPNYDEFHKSRKNDSYRLNQPKVISYADIDREFGVKSVSNDNRKRCHPTVQPEKSSESTVNKVHDDDSSTKHAFIVASLERLPGETTEERKERKKLVKNLQREKRKINKMMKESFNVARSNLQQVQKTRQLMCLN